MAYLYFYVKNSRKIGARTYFAVFDVSPKRNKMKNGIQNEESPMQNKTKKNERRSEEEKADGHTNNNKQFSSKNVRNNFKESKIQPRTQT